MRALAVPLIALSLFLSSTSTQALEVVTTIKPLQLIAEALTLDGDPPQQLLANSASPHDYQLRPSDIRKLRRADLVIWIGPQLESFLRKPLANLPTATNVLQLMPIDDHGDPEQTGAIDQPHAHGHDHGHESEQGESHPDHRGTADPHIWLDPDGANAIAAQISARLISLDPRNRDRYQAKLARFRHQVAETDQQIRALLQPLTERGYFVFHDAYGHFEKHYRLKHLGAFTLNPERPPGARHLSAIRARLQQPNAVCVFSEPQFKPALVTAVTEGLAVGTGTLDPLGSDARRYEELLLNLAKAFSRCLTDGEMGAATQ